MGYQQNYGVLSSFVSAYIRGCRVLGPLEREEKGQRSRFNSYLQDQGAWHVRVRLEPKLYILLE